MHSSCGLDLLPCCFGVKCVVLTHLFIHLNWLHTNTLALGWGEEKREIISIVWLPMKIPFFLYVDITIELDSVTFNPKQPPQARLSVFRMNYNHPPKHTHLSLTKHPSGMCISSLCCWGEPQWNHCTDLCGIHHPNTVKFIFHSPQ